MKQSCGMKLNAISKRHKIMLLGSGELGKEFVFAAHRLGLTTIAVDRYKGAPAMQVADHFEVIDMLSSDALEAVVQKHRPDVIVPEIEAIRTSKLSEFEARGIQVVPTAEAAYLTMNRDAIRDVAASELKLKTAPFMYAESREELERASAEIGFPNVVKPVMSSSGKGQSVVRKARDVGAAWQCAVKGMRGDKPRVIVEKFIRFESEITLLTIRQKRGPTLFAPPIGHRQESGDYRESWMPAKISAQQLKRAQAMAKSITDRLGGAGLFGVEFFLARDDVYFSELSPRPHDTGLVTLVSQNLSEFELHLRAIMGLPIPKIESWGAAASSVILAPEILASEVIGDGAPRAHALVVQSDHSFEFIGVDRALKLGDVELRLFGKPAALPKRRMGVALARAKTVSDAVKLAKRASSSVKLHPIGDEETATS